MSPLLYGALFSATSDIKKYESIPKENGKYILSHYDDIVKYKIFEELSIIKTTHNADEVVLAFDDSKGGYWRKDIWEGYKSKRKDVRDKSDIQWEEAYPIFEEVHELLDKCSSYKCIKVPRTEADDVIFVLSQFFSIEGDKTVIVSSDHDFIQCLKYPGVEFYRTKKTQMKDPEFYKATGSELEDIVMEHCISGDPGDGFYHIKSYSRFSDDFIEMYPQFKGKEKELYPKRFKIETLFEEKTGKKAYNHPRFGYKTFLRSKSTLNELLNENEIYKWNYEMNRKLALPENISQDIKSKIVKEYKNANSTPDYGCLTKYFTENRIIELIGKVSMF
jgi:hypothetical protein